MEIIQCNKVGLAKKSQPILQNISFKVEQGELLGIAGPSGSGKSSLLRILNLLQSPTEGTVSYKNQDIRQYNPMKLRREIGYVLQKPYLFAGTVRDNLEYSYFVWKQKPDDGEMNSYLTRVNLSPGVLAKHGGELSGGEQQRVAFVRSLLAKPEVLLLDEISAALDKQNTLVLEQLIQQEQAARNLTVLFISHNTDQLRRLARRMIYLEQGRLNYCGQVEPFFQARGGVNNG